MEMHQNIMETIGRTPLLRLNRVPGDIQATIAVKLEFFNPSGSVKDRAVASMIQRAERLGELKPGGTVVEATSGNTGYATAMLAAAKGYRAIIVCSDKVVQEKIDTLRAFGAEVIRSSSDATREDADHYSNIAKRIAEENENTVYISQSYNPGNPEGHYLTTGPEIWGQTEGKITSFITSAGTGGTISGVGKYLKEQNSKVEIALADPVGSVYHGYITTGEISPSSPYLIEAAGQDELYIPPSFTPEVVNRVIQVTDEEAVKMAHRLAKEEGIFCGMSSGLIVHAAVELAKDKGPEDLIVAIVCDAGDRYLSRLYSQDWLEQHFPGS